MNTRSMGRSLSLTMLTAVGLLGVGLAPSAHAQIRSPGQLLQQQVCAPLVSVSWCSDPRNQTDLCWGYNNDACAQTLRNAFDTSYHNLTTGPTPAGESPHGTYSLLLPNNMTNGGKLSTGARVSYDQSNLRYIDYDLSYSSIAAIRQRAINFGHFDLLTMTANTSPLHPEWEVDGNAINDTDRFDYSSIPPAVHHGQPCAEYVYKKYYDYNRWEDAAASCKSDWICVYNLGVTTTMPGLNHYPLKKKQGTPMTVQLPMTFRAQSQPKNGFWKIDPGQFSDWFAYRNRYDVYNGIGAAARQVQPYTIYSRWGWHVQMHDQQAHENLTLAAYQDMEDRQKNITSLYDAFVATRQTLLSVGGARDVFDIMNPHTILQTGCADMIQLDPQTGQPLPCQHPIHQLPSYPAGSLQQVLQYTVQHIADALIAEWDHKSYADGTTVDHGCFDPSSNRCDWEPKMFAQEYLGLFRTEREQDFQTCFDKTGQVFSTQNLPPMYPADHSDTDHLESWMATVDGIVGPLLADVPWTTDASGHPVVGRNKHGGKTLGDSSVFAVDYNYSAGYEAAFTRGGSDGQTICGVNGHAGGSFYADVQIPVIGTQAIIDAALQARAGQGGDPTVYANGHLSVFGVSLYSSGGEVSLSGFNLSPADPNRMHTNTGYDTIIMVSFVPVHLHAGIDFSTGLNWNVSGGAPQNCSSDNAALMSLTGNITPWANVSADLSAAVGVTLAGFGAEAGVRGDLSILQASLPVNLSFSVGDAYFPSVGQRYLSLMLNTTSAIELSALSGSISAYAEVCYILCESVEKEIFRWNGVNLGHVSLFPSLNEAFPLIRLKTATPRVSP